MSMTVICHSEYYKQRNGCITNLLTILTCFQNTPSGKAQHNWNHHPKGDRSQCPTCLIVPRRSVLCHGVFGSPSGSSFMVYCNVVVDSPLPFCGLSSAPIRFHCVHFHASSYVPRPPSSLVLYYCPTPVVPYHAQGLKVDGGLPFMRLVVRLVFIEQKKKYGNKLADSLIFLLNKTSLSNSCGLSFT